MNIIIRKAELSDIEIVQKFGAKLLEFERKNYDSSLDESWALSDEAKTKYLNAIQSGYVTIAEIEGRPIGFLIGNIVSPKSSDARQIKQAYLQNIYVDKEFRKTGAGRTLVKDFKERCKDSGVNRLNVSVLAANEIAIKFYNSIGFKPRSINLSLEP